MMTVPDTKARDCFAASWRAYKLWRERHGYQLDVDPNGHELVKFAQDVLGGFGYTKSDVKEMDATLREALKEVAKYLSNLD